MQSTTFAEQTAGCPILVRVLCGQGGQVRIHMFGCPTLVVPLLDDRVGTCEHKQSGHRCVIPVTVKSYGRE